MKVDKDSVANRVEHMRLVTGRGYKITCTHYRNVKSKLPVIHAGNSENHVSFEFETYYPVPLFEIRRQNLFPATCAKGGYTVVRIFSREKGIEAHGESRCHSNDVFNNKIGFTKAFYAALSDLQKAETAIKLI